MRHEDRHGGPMTFSNWPPPSLEPKENFTTMRLVIKTPLMSLNETIATAKNQSSTYSPYSRQKREAEQTVALEISSQLKTYQKKFPYMDKWAVPKGACFHFRWYAKNKRRDPDNIASACKFLFDAMIKQGCLANDNWEYIKFISHDFYVDKASPRVEIHISTEPYLTRTTPRS